LGNIPRADVLGTTGLAGISEPPLAAIQAALLANGEDHGHVSDREIPAAAWRQVRDGETIASALGDHGPGLLDNDDI
jgi:hypothetical protein